MNREKITVSTSVNAHAGKVWELWNGPEHIIKWNTATDTWHTPTATNDLQKGGKLTARMEAKDGSMGFDFEGIYDEIVPNKLIKYTIADGREVSVSFSSEGNVTNIIETFEAEGTNPLEIQKNGWQAILDNFKKYAESN